MTGWALSPAAIDDLDAILTYVEQESGSASAAERLLSEFRETFELLAAQPHAGPVREDIAGPGIRWWFVHGYVVLYRPEPAPVRIVRVIHGSRELGAALHDEPPTRP